LVTQHFHSNSLSSCATLADSHAKDKDKGSSRHLFTDVELELLTRNAEEVLQLHEHFVEELRTVVEPLGFSMFSHETASDVEIRHKAESEIIDTAIGVVSTKFATEVR
jgi:hypothetical protein